MIFPNVFFFFTVFLSASVNSTIKSKKKKTFEILQKKKKGKEIRQKKIKLMSLKWILLGLNASRVYRYKSESDTNRRVFDKTIPNGESFGVM